MPLTPNPLQELEPDFDSEPYTTSRQALTDLGFPEANITPILHQNWQADRQVCHIAWEVARDEEEAAAAAAVAPQQDQAGDSNKTSAKAGDFPAGITIPSLESLSPLDYAHQKLSKFQWVKLWYFTREGCIEATVPTTSFANETFSITTEDSDMIHLRPIAATKASRNAIPNMALSWDQIAFAAKILVRIMKEELWPAKHTSAMIDFFCALDIQQSHLAYDGDQALIEYQATVRKAWFDTLGSNRAFDLTPINLKRLHAIESRLTLTAHRQAMVRTSYPNYTQPSTNKPPVHPSHTPPLSAHVPHILLHPHFQHGN